jgi:hypothetical protein
VGIGRDELVGHHRNPPPQSGREPGCVAHHRVAARYARARPLSKPPGGAISSPRFR